MKTKICKKCKNIMALNYFKEIKKQSGKIYLGNICQNCRSLKQKLHNKKYYIENKESILQQKKEYYNENIENITQKNKINYENNKEERKEDSRKYYKNNKENVFKKNKKYREENKKNLAQKEKEYRDRNCEVIAQRKHEYYEKNKEYILQKRKIYIYNNKEKVNDSKLKYQKNKRLTDPIYACMKDVSRQISLNMKKNGGSKNRISCQDKLGYNGEDLMNHLEKHFGDLDNLTPNGKVWMTRHNRGVYKQKEWDDNDPTTWRWQLDHIIPQSDTPFDSYEHPNFLKCWDIFNLRPLCAKINNHEGSTQTRHKIKKRRGKNK